MLPSLTSPWSRHAAKKAAHGKLVGLHIQVIARVHRLVNVFIKLAGYRITIVHIRGARDVQVAVNVVKEMSVEEDVLVKESRIVGGQVGALGRGIFPKVHAESSGEHGNGEVLILGPKMIITVMASQAPVLEVITAKKELGAVVKKC